MGTRIQVAGADYSVNKLRIYTFADFGIKSDFVLTGVYDGNVLTVTRGGTTGNFSTAASATINKAIVTQRVASAMTINCVVLGQLSDNNYAVLYLAGSGAVRKFYKAEPVVADLLYQMTGSLPTVAKGSPVTVEKKADRFTISYTGYAADILFSSIPNLTTPAIGVLYTAGGDTYDFVAIS